MNATDIMKCGVREQRALSVIADSISKVVKEHDGTVPEEIPPADESENRPGSGMFPDNKPAVRAYLAKINVTRARVGMEIKMLTQYLERTDSLLSDLEAAIETLRACSDPAFSDMAGRRANDLILSRAVYTQMRAACEATISRYGEYSEMLSTSVNEMSLALKQSKSIELAEIYAKVRNAAKQSSSKEGFDL